MTFSMILNKRGREHLLCWWPSCFDKSDEVGTQSISPLNWAIKTLGPMKTSKWSSMRWFDRLTHLREAMPFWLDRISCVDNYSIKIWDRYLLCTFWWPVHIFRSGSFNVARAMLADLLTIRAWVRGCLGMDLSRLDDVLVLSLHMLQSLQVFSRHLRATQVQTGTITTMVTCLQAAFARYITVKQPLVDQVWSGEKVCRTHTGLACARMWCTFWTSSWYCTRMLSPA